MDNVSIRIHEPLPYVDVDVDVDVHCTAPVCQSNRLLGDVM